MTITIPGRGTYALSHLVLDVNGTVAAGGRLIDGVRDQLLALREAGWQIHWITADTRGRQAALDEELGSPAGRVAASAANRTRYLGRAQPTPGPQPADRDLAQIKKGLIMTEKERIAQLEEQIEQLKARLPRHSVPPAMILELEDLEDELTLLKARVHGEQA